MGLWAAIRRLGRGPARSCLSQREAETAALRRKMDTFLGLLGENRATHRIIADLEEKVAHGYVFDETYLRQSVRELEAAVGAMVRLLGELTGDDCPGIDAVARGLFASLRDDLDWQPSTANEALVLRFRAIRPTQRRAVGRKNLRLATMRNELNIPVPPGFAITARAYLHFIGSRNLGAAIAAWMQQIDPARPGDLVTVARELQATVRGHPVPTDLSDAIEAACRRLFREGTRGAGVAIRSSALREDGVASFAGQYATMLNVPPKEVVQAYREIVASAFSARAIYYLLSRGFRTEDLAMSVVCQTTVPSVASGVLYTVDPMSPESGRMVVNAAWGLGLPIVEGSVRPDVCYLDRHTGEIADVSVAHKPTQLRLRDSGGVTEAPVPPDLRDAPAVTADQLRTLAEYGRRLDAHYGRPQDVEWAVDPAGRVQILQSRSLRIRRTRDLPSPALQDPGGGTVLLKGGAVASPGVAAGPVYLLRMGEDLDGFPQGGVLVAPQPLPELVMALGRAAAVVCDTGGVACHLAALAREFNVPTLLNTGNATTVLSPGQLVTVDTVRCCVFEGRAAEALQPGSGPPEVEDPEETDAYRLFQRLLPKIAPLRLVDPRHPNFRPECCETVHDVTRLIHQTAMREMVRLAERLTDAGWQAPSLEADVPLSIQVLDLGVDSNLRSMGDGLRVDQVSSMPFKLFLAALAEHPWPGPRSVSLGSFISVMAIHASGAHHLAAPCLAIVSEDYMNFSLRTGYHYSTVEALYPESGSEGYVRFHFRGGGAPVECRGRREQLIHELLLCCGFVVDQRSEMVGAIAENLDGEAVRQKLALLAHLTVYTKQLDVMLTDDAVTQWYIEEFKRQNRL